MGIIGENWKFSDEELRRTGVGGFGKKNKFG